jgi:penicillin amidase
MAARLEEWEGRADLESREATLFHSWWSSLRGRFRDVYYEGTPGYFPSTVVEKALAGDVPMPTGLVEDAARDAASYADLPWGETHTLTLDHPLAQVPWIGSLLKFGRSGIPRVGGPYSINVAGFNGTSPPFRTGYGPSQRHVVDMADPDGSGGFILPGGQSGYPANPHSFDQLEKWRQGRLWLLPLDRSGTTHAIGVENRTVATVRLLPPSG